MTQLGVRVPAGFTITTDACRAFMQTKELPEGLEAEVDEHVRRLEVKTGKRFGSSDDPLLVSVRSGAAVSMPGMMDTILNLGLNDEAAEGLAARTGNPRFAFDSYRRLIQMYGEVVDGIDGHRFEEALSALKKRVGCSTTPTCRRRICASWSRRSSGSTGGDGRRLPGGCEGSAAAGGAGCVSQSGRTRGRRSTGGCMRSRRRSGRP